MKSRHTTVNVSFETRDTLKKIAETKRWNIKTLLDFFAEMFVSSMELLNDKNSTVQNLRNHYSEWQLAISPSGEW